MHFSISFSLSVCLLILFDYDMYVSRFYAALFMNIYKSQGLYIDMYTFSLQ